MPTPAEEVRDLYSAGMREVNRVVLQGSEGEVQTGLQTLDDLTAMMLANEIVSVRGRTALLNGLIVELTQVIDNIEEESPVAGVLDKIGSILDRAGTLLTSEKKQLLAGG